MSTSLSNYGGSDGYKFYKGTSSPIPNQVIIGSDNVTEGTSNLYFTNARARSAISASGSLSYDSATGVVSYTHPSILTNLDITHSDDSTVGSAKSIKTYVDAQILTKDNLDEIAEGTTNVHFTASDNTKLDGIETAATADQTGAQIKTAYEAESDTNAFTDADETKLDGIEASATADQTDAEIRTAVEAATDSNVFTDADHTKLDSIESSADVTDATNVTAAGALMDSELTDLAGVKGVTISTLQSKPSEGAFVDGDKTKLDGVAASANNYAISSDLLDEDNMATDSATKVPSQQSVKAYVDSQVGTVDTLGEVLANGGTTSSLSLRNVISDETGTGSLVFTNTPTLITPNLGTPASGTLTNCTFPTLNQDTTGTAATVTGAAQTAITSVGTLTGLAATGTSTGDYIAQIENSSDSGHGLKIKSGTSGNSTQILGAYNSAAASCLSVRSDRRVGIGVAVPSAKFDVRYDDSSGADSVIFKDSGDTACFEFNSQGEAYIRTELGIATTTPQTRLHLTADASSTYTDGIMLGHEANNNYGLGLWHNTTGNGTSYIEGREDSASAEMKFRMRADGTAVDAMTILGDGVIDIESGKLKIAGLSGTDGQVLTTGGDGTIAWEDGGGGGGGGSLDNVSEDSTPQLGGDLDVNGNKIVTTSNGDIVLEPNGTGKVGIGTDSPTKELQVAGEFRVKDGSSALWFSEYSDNATLWFDGSDGDFSGGDYFQITADGADALRFGYAASDKVSMLANGSVGIGTAAPTNAKLVINHASTSTPTDNIELLGTSITTGGGTGLFLKASNSTTASRFGSRIHTVREATNNGATSLVFSTDDSSSLNEAMRIDSSGNVGIGTTAPASVLHIEGGSNNEVLKLANSTADFRHIIADGTYRIYDNDDTAYRFYIDTGGAVSFDGSSDFGTSGQVLTSNGSGSSPTWEDVSGGGSLDNVSEDSSPQLGNHLDVNGYKIVTASGSDDDIVLEPDGTGGVGIKDGKALQLWNSGDTNYSTIDSPANGVMAFSTGGIPDAMYIANDGSVGIGTTSPSAELEILQSAGNSPELKLTSGTVYTKIIADDASGFSAIDYSHDLRFKDAGTETMRIDSDGNVLVGAAPKIHASSTAAYYTNQAAGTTILSTFDSNEKVTCDATGFIQFETAGVAALRIDSSQNVGIGTTAPTAKLTVAGAIAFDASVNGVINTENSIRINIDSDDSGTGESFIVGHNQTAIDQNDVLFKVQENGKVGIGTTAPDFKLQVNDGTSAIGLCESSSHASIWLDGVNGDFSGGDYYGIHARDGGAALDFSYAGTNRLSILSGGNVGIGTAAPAKLLDITGAAATMRFTETGTGARTWEVGSGIVSNGTWSVYDVSTGADRFSINSYGSVAFNGDYGNSGDILYTDGDQDEPYWEMEGMSDARLKENVKEISALDDINKLRPVEFDWKAEAEEFHRRGHASGLIAQEVEEVFPQLIREKRGMKGVDYKAFTPLLIQAIKELTDENKLLRERLDAVEQKVQST